MWPLLFFLLTLALAETVGEYKKRKEGGKIIVTVMVDTQLWIVHEMADIYMLANAWKRSWVVFTMQFSLSRPASSAYLKHPYLAVFIKTSFPNPHGIISEIPIQGALPHFFPTFIADTKFEAINEYLAGKDIEFFTFFFSPHTFI